MLVPNIKLIMIKEKNHNYHIKSSDEVYKVIKTIVFDDLKKSPVEIFGYIGLETNNKIVFIDSEQVGSINESRVYISNIAKKLLLTNCSQVILFHNHPSGNTKVSDSDIDITTKIQTALKLFEIKVLDHLICADDDYVSFKELGYIN